MDNSRAQISDAPRIPHPPADAACRDMAAPHGASAPVPARFRPCGIAPAPGPLLGQGIAAMARKGGFLPGLGPTATLRRVGRTVAPGVAHLGVGPPLEVPHVLGLAARIGVDVEPHRLAATALADLSIMGEAGTRRGEADGPVIAVAQPHAHGAIAHTAPPRARPLRLGLAPKGGRRLEKARADPPVEAGARWPAPPASALAPEGVAFERLAERNLADILGRQHHRRRRGKTRIGCARHGRDSVPFRDERRIRGPGATIERVEHMQDCQEKQCENDRTA